MPPLEFSKSFKKIITLKQVTKEASQISKDKKCRQWKRRTISNS
jgi:hypothetical protein